MSYQRHISQLGAQLKPLTKSTKTSPIVITTHRKRTLGTLYNTVITRFYKNL
ncbi:MAG: hypothetical protein K0S11_684 [Gammaproteobacteria bacterium]|jgi:D-serine deaminase-like pyridoxal phosphate-dependent protein|nr:hypothetical protein [Gammaproteobacteria bacterium]